MRFSPSHFFSRPIIKPCCLLLLCLGLLISCFPLLEWHSSGWQFWAIAISFDRIIFPFLFAVWLCLPALVLFWPTLCQFSPNFIFIERATEPLIGISFPHFSPNSSLSFPHYPSLTLLPSFPMWAPSLLSHSQASITPFGPSQLQQLLFGLIPFLSFSAESQFSLSISCSAAFLCNLTPDSSILNDLTLVSSSKFHYHWAFLVWTISSTIISSH